MLELQEQVGEAMDDVAAAWLAAKDAWEGDVHIDARAAPNRSPAGVASLFLDGLPPMDALRGARGGIRGGLRGACRGILFRTLALLLHARGLRRRCECEE